MKFGDTYESAIRNQVFIGSNQAARAVSAALATTYTGLCLSNDAGTGKNLILLRANYALTVAPVAIASMHLIGGSGTVTHTTPETPESSVIGSTAGVAVGKIDRAATIPTPRYLMSLMSGFTAAALPNFSMPSFEFKGEIIIPPGGFVALGALTALTGFGSFIWAEVKA